MTFWKNFENLIIGFVLDVISVFLAVYFSFYFALNAFVYFAASVNIILYTFY